MKKLISLLLVTVVCLTLVPTCLAKNEPAVQIVNYTYDEAKAAIGEMGWEGSLYNLKSEGLKYWMPNTLYRMQLTEEALADGYLEIFSDLDWKNSVEIRVGSFDMDTKEFMEFLKDCGAEKVELQDINGQEFILYSVPYSPQEIKKLPKGTPVPVCRVASLVRADGTVLEFVCNFDSAEKDLLIRAIMACIRPM